MSKAQFNTLVIKDIRRETPEAVSIAFDVPEPLAKSYRFEQGQYLTLRTVIEGQDTRRSYSICSGLDEGELRVAIKQVEGGLFSSFANQNLKSGDRLQVMPPMGRFTSQLDFSAARNYLGIACGSGITPILSILKSVLSREPKSRFTLLYGNRNMQSILFREALEDLKDRYLDRLSVHHILSREGQDIALLQGRIDAAKITSLLRQESMNIDLAFLCGPQEMTEAARSTLLALGVENAHIHVELFTPSGQTGDKLVSKPNTVQHDKGPSLHITFDGTTQIIHSYPEESIIDAAHRVGLDLPYSCKGGMCCTCRAKVTSGTVEMVANYSLEPWELTAGFTLACQAHATSTEVSVDFDAV